MLSRGVQRKAKNMTTIYNTTDLDTNVKSEEIDAIIKAKALDTIANTRETDIAVNTRERNNTTKTGLTTKCFRNTEPYSGVLNLDKESRLK